MCTNDHVTGLRGTQWAKASEERDMSSVIVLLADKPKEELDDLVDELRKETGLEIMAREGRPYSLDDLDLVSAADAGTIVIMDPGHHLHGQVRRRQHFFARFPGPPTHCKTVPTGSRPSLLQICPFAQICGSGDLSVVIA